MNLDNSVAMARGARSPRVAAELHNNISLELALGFWPPEAEELGELALAELESRFPNVKADAADVTTPPALSRSAKRALDGEPGKQPVRRSGPVRREPEPLGVTGIVFMSIFGIIILGGVATLAALAVFILSA